MFTFALDFISGETSASKSSMLNLILGEELLPFSVLSTTSTICELKYWKKRIIKVHYKQEGKDPETKVLDDSSSYLELISTFVQVSKFARKSTVQNSELFWPHSLLKVIIWVHISLAGPGGGSATLYQT